MLKLLRALEWEWRCLVVFCVCYKYVMQAGDIPHTHDTHVKRSTNRNDSGRQAQFFDSPNESIVWHPNRAKKSVMQCMQCMPSNGAREKNYCAILCAVPMPMRTGGTIIIYGRSVYYSGMHTEFVNCNPNLMCIIITL